MDDLVCEWCDAPFSRPSDMGPSPKFCSASHRQRAYEVRRIEGLVSDLTAERDRLRAVVDEFAAMGSEYKHALEHVASCGGTCHDCQRLARSALAHENLAGFRLDGSGDMGGDT